MASGPEDGAHLRRHPWLTAAGAKYHRMAYASAPTHQALRVADPRIVRVGATSSSYVILTPMIPAVI
jgi:hypothetical protein